MSRTEHHPLSEQGAEDLQFTKIDVDLIRRSYEAGLNGRRTLPPPDDRAPLADLLRGHVQLLMPEVEACAIRMRGEQHRIALRVLSVSRGLLADSPRDGASYIRDLATQCRALLTLYRLHGTAGAEPRSVGHPGYSLTLPRTPESVREARQFVRVCLAVWGLDVYADATVLIMSELVTNAVLHARGPAVRISVDRPTHDRVQLGVVDRAPSALPHMRMPSAGGLGGRGLLLVDELADRWGTDLKGSGTRWGKRVWADLDVSHD
ncbi:DUF6415 family natural product biosynthesis protein [Streptomyces turgidiscabies]|uniref:DUF6415 family natural product biosynthesis protein n=1 Tax=Streptomyces turgidiscabies TaxID=85558 RepID=UPI0038F7740A